MFRNNLLSPRRSDGLYVVTQSLDYLDAAHQQRVIQGRLGLKHDMFCMDINQGCAGFVIGLLQSFLLLDQPSVNRVVLINVDVMSRKTSAKDRNSYPLVGDAASITVIERTDDDDAIHATLKMDGARREVHPR